jgi:hypothetical protein
MQHAVEWIMVDTSDMGRRVSEAEAWDLLCNKKQSALYCEAQSTGSIKGEGLDRTANPS